MIRKISVILFFAVSFTLLGFGTAPGSTDIVRKDHYIQSTDDPGIRLYVREKYSAGKKPEQMAKAVLFLHGATYPGNSFDIQQPGYSWMDYVVKRGYAAYYLDIRGYGRSTRPPAMEQDPKKNQPICRYDVAVKDIDDAVNFILKQTGKKKIFLVGWSWGTVTCGAYTSVHNKKVEKLVLFAPLYSSRKERFTKKFAAKDNPKELRNDIGAYFLAEDPTGKEWTKSVKPEVFRTWITEVLDTDPKSGQYKPKRKFRAPYGAKVDAFYCRSERPVYDATKITVPTLIIRGNQDTIVKDINSRVLLEKISSPVKRYIIVGNGTHILNLQDNHDQLFLEVQTFMDNI